MTRVALVCFVALCGCSKGTWLKVFVDGSSSGDALTATVTNGGATTQVSIDKPYSMPTSFVLSFDTSRSGRVEVSVTAFAGGNAIGSRQGSTELRPGGSAELHLDFSASTGDGGNLQDLGSANLGDLGGVVTDLAVVPVIVRVGATTSNISSGVALAVPVPAGLANGDLVLVSTWYDDPTKTITPPGSLTQLATLTQPGIMVNDWYWRVATAADGPYTFSFSGAVTAGGMAVAYRGATSVAMTTPAQLGQPFTLPMVTTTKPNTMVAPLITFFASAVIDWTAPAELTLVKAGVGTVDFERYVTTPGTVTLGSPSTTSNPNTIYVETALISSQ